MADLRSKFIEDYAGGLLNVSRQELASTGQVLSQDGLLTGGTLFVEDGTGTKSGLKLGASLCEVIDPTTDQGVVNVRYADRTYASVRDLKIFSTAIASAQAALSDASSVSLTNLENAFELLETEQDNINKKFDDRSELINARLEELEEIPSLQGQINELNALAQLTSTRVTSLEAGASEAGASEAGASIDLKNVTSGITLSTGSSQQDPDSKKINSLVFKGFNSKAFATCAEIYSEVDDPLVYDPVNTETHGVPGSLHFSVTKQGATSPVQRMRIDQQGAFAIQSTASCLFVSSESAVGGTNAVFIGRHSATTFPSGTVTSYIWTNGGLANYQSNNSDLSDIREKKNIEPLDSTWDKVKSWELKKYHYNFDEDSSDKRYGVIAQDLEETCPDLVTIWNEDNAENAKLGVKAQQMDWMAIRTLQEAQLKIEQLEAKVAALEAAG